MKRLGLFVLTVLFAVGIFGVFPTSRVSAQATDPTSYDTYQAIVDGYFQASNTALDDLATRGPADAEAVPKFKTYISILSNAYTNTFNAEKNKGTPPAQAQIAAIVSFNQALTSGPNLAPIARYAQSAPERSVVTQLSSKMKDAFVTATQIKMEVIAAGSAEATVQTDGASTVTNAAKGNTNKPVETSEKSDACSLLSGDLLDCANSLIGWLIKNTLLQIAGFLLWITANMFNYSIQIGVLQFAKWVPDQIYPIWLIIRQIVSLIIVFIGLYLGFMYILGKDEKFQKYIPWVIMFALFVNFSYPITRTMVDISNVVSLNIYASVVGPDALNAGITDENTAGALITNRLGLKGLIAGAVSGDVSSGGPDMLKSVKGIPASLIAVCFVLYAAYIFLIITGIFLMRTFVLVLLIVASPLLLVDSVLPLLGERAKMLRKVFFEQLVVGPVFMIMFALTLKFLLIFSSSGAMGSPVAGTTGADTIKTFFNLIMMLVMLHVMVKVTKSTAGELGNFASNAMGTVGGFAMGAAAGGTGLLARQGLGRLATKAKENGWVTEDSNSFMGRRAYALTNSVANSKFDLRNTAVAGKMSKLGMGMGMGAKMGYEEASKKKAEEVAAVSARIKTKYERDMYGTDANGNKVLVGRKGDVDPEGVARRERFHQNQDGAVFLTKEQKEATDAAFIDESSSKDMEEYKKKDSKEERAKFAANIKEQLEAVNKKEGNTTSPKAQALMRTIHDIKKKEGEDKDAFDKQLGKEIDKYNATSTGKKEDYLARLDKDMREALKSNIDPKTGMASMPQHQTEAPTSTPQPLTGSAVRQERIQKVTEGRAKQVEEVTGGQLPGLYSEVEQAQAKQQASTARAATFSENRNQNTPINTTQPFNVEEQVTTMSFAQQAAAKRIAAQQKATQIAQAQMAANTKGNPPESPNVDTPNPTPKPPVTPVASSAKDPITV